MSCCAVVARCHILVIPRKPYRTLKAWLEKKKKESICHCRMRILLRMQYYISFSARKWMEHNKRKINRLLDSDYFASYQLLHLNGACLCPPEGRKMFCITVVVHKPKQHGIIHTKKGHILEHAFVKLKCILPLIHILIGCKKMGNKLLFEFRVLLIIGIIHQPLLSLWACVTAN